MAHAPDKPLFRKQVEAGLTPGRSCQHLAPGPIVPGALSLGRQWFQMLNQAPRGEGPVPASARQQSFTQFAVQSHSKVLLSSGAG